MGRRKYFTFLVYGSLVISSLFAAPGLASGQAAVDIVVSGFPVPGAILLVDREKTLEQGVVRDSFAAFSTNPLTFRITGLRAPEPATIYLGDTNFRVLLVPGFRLMLTAEVNASGGTIWKQSGPAARLNETFDSSFARFWPEYKKKFSAADASLRLQLFSRALENNLEPGRAIAPGETTTPGIGIAVSDKSADWKKALRQDKPGWLQLIDKNTIVTNAYAVTSVPRYVLIDREGKIIDFHAPAPADYQRLIDTIEKELQF